MKPLKKAAAVPMRPSLIRLSVRLPDLEAQKLEQALRRCKQNPSDFIRRAIRKEVALIVH